MKKIHRNQHINRIGLKDSTVRGLFKLFFFGLFTLMTINAVRYYTRIAYYQWRDENVIAPCANFCNSMFKVGTVYAAEDNTPTLENITAYIIKKFQPHGRSVAVKAIACFISESGLRPEAFNTNTNKTHDYGIPQINSIHIKKYGDRIKTDWKYQIDVAEKIYVSRGNNFSAWYGKYCN